MHQIGLSPMLWVSRNLIILTLDYMRDIKFEKDSQFDKIV